jgi:hypothetical protein
MVGPKRRVVFRSGVTMDKSAIKRALQPLAGYWSKPSEGDHEPGAKVQPGVSVMGMHEFKTKARRLLVDAGLLVSKAADEGD